MGESEAGHVSDEEAIDLLVKLVSIPSVSREERSAVEFLSGWMSERGLPSRVDGAGNAVGSQGFGSREILLLGHIDTFPGEVPVRREGDLFYGRGSVDAKGPLCAFAVAAARASVADDFKVTVVGAVEEEAATSKGARRVVSDRREHSVDPYCCVIGEPSRWDRVTLGYKGRLLLDVKLRSPFSHSAGQAPLPAEVGVGLWQEIERYCEEWNEKLEAKSAFDRVLVSLRSINSEDAGTIGIVRLSIGFRLPERLSPAELEADLSERLKELGNDLDLSFSGGEVAYRSGKANPLVRAFLKSIREHDGNPRFVVKTGTADMNVVAPHWPNTPMLAYGPGDSSLDHTPDEHVDVGEYLRSIDVLSGVLRGLMA